MSLTTESTYPRDAKDFLIAAADTLDNRAALRDAPNGERAMARAVEIFHALTGTRLTEQQGLAFMISLKWARSERGKVNADDYVDMLGYFALLAESLMRTPDARKDDIVRTLISAVWPKHP